MNVINRKALREMIEDHPEAGAALEAWWKLTKAARWQHLQDCRDTIMTADQAGRCLIFDILGNRYRLITVISWRNQRIYIKALLTHRQYERESWHKWAF